MNDVLLWGLFLSAFLSSTLLPGGSEAVLAILTSQQSHPLWLLLTVATAGNTLGGMTSWGIGRLIAIRYSVEQIIASTQSPSTNHRDEGRGCCGSPHPNPPLEGEGMIADSPEIEEEGMMLSSQEIEGEGMIADSPEIEEEGMMLSSQEIEEEGMIADSPEIEEEGMMLGSPEIEREGIMLGSQEIEGEGMMLGSPEIKREGVMADSREIEGEGMMLGSREIEGEGMMLGSQEIEGEGTLRSERSSPLPQGGGEGEGRLTDSLLVPPALNKGDKHQPAIERIRRWGSPVLLLSWLPVIGDPLCVAAGWLRIHWLLSLVLIGIGKTVRYLVVIYLFS